MSSSPTPARPEPARALPKASPTDTARVVGALLLPAVVAGVIRRRPGGMAFTERVHWDQRGLRTMAGLRTTYGDGPLLLRVAGRTVALPLVPEDVGDILDRTPTPFSPATWEKRGALSQFQPHGSLISEGPERAERRQVNEAALDTPQPLHHLAPTIVATVRDEAAALLRQTNRTGELTWDEFGAAWWRSVRRLVLGDAARDDETLTHLLNRLRSAGNWSVLLPRRRRVRDDFLRRLRQHAVAAGPTTLAGALTARPASERADTVGQIPHWLFAYDAAAITTLRTLAMLTSHPEHEARARAEVAVGGHGSDQPRTLPFLRACAQETLRLWPTTPLLLRESTEPTQWRGQSVPARTAFLIYTPYFHRSPDTAGPDGDRYVPERWLDGRAQNQPALVPFSAGPAECPGRNLVLLTVSTWLAALLEGHTFQPPAHAPRPHQDGTLPAEFNPFALRFTVRADAGA
ncbi:cytochrome P450 [Streptomyces sp. AC536]|uniref:cytochrome P450 n=1 Tax=Streptomyces buecherae TaxID=2763006 RepID=UPI00164D3403|nr:cytochrome P450 [Streptomyces buecherae]MBC3983892.1 cytochrome P450 [Streptomyces buecherae]QNJ42417.1 cytochrome P450 [Streptomyces buecherae]